MIAVSVILEKLDNCFLPKLSRNLEESEKHEEFEKWNSNLTENFPAVFKVLNDLDLKDCSSPSTVLSTFLLLYLQLHSNGQWKIAKSEEYAQKLNYHFQLLYEIPLSNLLKTNAVHDTQEVFDKSMELLHYKLTPDNFKKYPALSEAYFAIVRDIKDYNVVIKPVLVMPASLLLIEDYVKENKLKGLKCCSSILKCLSVDNFKDGNYYEVMYRVLQKTIVERDVEVSKLVLNCLLDLLKILPPHAKVTTTDEALGIVLDQINTDSNLYRKKDFFYFMKEVTLLHGVNCVKRNMIPVIADNLEICCTETVAEILLPVVLKSLQNWIKYCWCVWKLSANKKLMLALMNVLYVLDKKAEIAIKILNIIIVLCKLSSQAEQEVVIKNIDKVIKNQVIKTSKQKEYASTLIKIKEDIIKLR